MKFSYHNTCLVDDQNILELLERLQPEIARIRAATNLKYETPYASINLPADTQMFDEVERIVQAKKGLRPAALVVIGIGGSNLGTKAVHEALRGTHHTMLDPLKVYYADTVDADYCMSLVACIEDFLQAGQVVILNIISKSGSTTETVANAQMFIDLIRCYHADYQQHIVVTTDYQSPLWELASKEGFTTLSIPAQVGGRYSVFSPVGLFPLGLIGINIRELVAGAQSVITQCTDDSIQNYAAVRAGVLYALYHARTISIHDFFIFAVHLQSVGAWYRQLMGESIGKADDIHGNRVERGIIPTVSIGSIDLHSVAQLYLGGPRIIMTTFLTVAQQESSLTVIPSATWRPLAPAIQGKTLGEIMQAIVAGTKAAYAQEARPFMEIELEQINEQSIGALLQMHMLEMMYLGYLLEVNPFDQPQVELYKKETRKILAHE